MPICQAKRVGRCRSPCQRAEHYSTTYRHTKRSRSTRHDITIIYIYVSCHRDDGKCNYISNAAGVRAERLSSSLAALRSTFHVNLPCCSLSKSSLLCVSTPAAFPHACVHYHRHQAYPHSSSLRTADAHTHAHSTHRLCCTSYDNVEMYGFQCVHPFRFVVALSERVPVFTYTYRHTHVRRYYTNVLALFCTHVN